MTQIQVEYFMKTYETRNIAVAADALFISRSAISRAIADLEREYQTELFIRSKTGVTPTPAGSMVYEMFRNVTGCFSRINTQIQELKTGTLNRRIRVGITPSNGLRLYEQFFRSFLKKYPDTELVLVEDARDRCSDMLSQGEIDIAVMPAGEASAKVNEDFFSSIPLYRNRIVFWTSIDSPLADREDLDIFDILDCPLGYLMAPMPLEDILENCFSAYGKKPHVTIRTSSAELLREMVIDGRACAIVPDDMFEPSDRMRAIRLHFFKESTQYVVWNHTIPCSDAVKRFLDHVEAIAKSQ